MTRRGWTAERRRRVACLQRLPELAGLDRRHVASLLSHFDEVHVEAGTTLAVAGRPAAGYALILEGCIELQGANGRWMLGAGESVGWDEMWTRRSCTSTVKAVVRTRLLVMGRGQFRAVRALETAPGVRARSGTLRSWWARVGGAARSDSFPGVAPRSR
jgi:CRP-like cAMP-binding protein